MTNKRVLLLVLVASVVLLAVGVQAAPLAQREGASGVTVPYTGRLSDEAGQPVADGAYDFSFALYATESGGEPLWSEEQENLEVMGGQIVTSLGMQQVLPAALVEGSGGLWLATSVRGPDQAGYARLEPRQQLIANSSSLAVSPDAAAPCPHDHVGEVWYANIAWSNGAFKVINSSNGPSIWGYNSGGGNALRGYAVGSGLGLYAESQDGAGAVGRSTNGHGIEGYSTSNGKAGVYAENNAGYGVYARSDNGWGVYCQGDMRVTQDLRVWGSSIFDGPVTFNAAKSGYVVDIAQNDDTVPLEVGDVVAISGAGPAVAGEIPVIKVRRAASEATTAVVGVVDKRYVPPSGAEDTGSFEGSVVGPGEYLSIVTLGSYQAIKVDASYGAIAPGDLLVASPNPGYAMRAAAPSPGTIIGKALDGLPEGTGVIPVIVTMQ